MRRRRPLCYPGTTVLKNTLDIRDHETLEQAQDDRAAARYAVIQASLPQPPFTFETLRTIHRALFGSIYAWAGEPRTIGISKADYDDPNGRITRLADPHLIAPMAGIIFNTIDHGRALMNLDRATFAAKAAVFLNDLNILHPFRGNGRSQRLLLSAVAEAAGHPVAFDVVTRERMVAASVSAQADIGSFVRLLEEITDPRRVDALRKALDAMKRFNAPVWNDLYVATTQAGQTYSGTLAGVAGQDFMLRVDAQPRAGSRSATRPTCPAPPRTAST